MATVLLVEDRDDVREVIKDAIVSAGYALECATTWAEGWRKLAFNHHDLLVADVRLPDGSGRDLARRAVGLGKRAVLITGHPNEVRRSQPEITYLRKPFLMRTILKAIEDHIGPPPEITVPSVDEPTLFPLPDAAPILVSPEPNGLDGDGVPDRRRLQ